MNKACFYLLSAILFLSGCNDRKETAAADAKPTVKIGVTLPLSGDIAFAGVPVKKSIELALQDIKKERNLKYDYELIFEDDKLDPKQTVMNMNRLGSVEKVNAIISMWGIAGPAVAKFANEHKMIHVGCSWGYEIAKGYYSFNNSTLPEEQAEVWVRELKKRNVKTLGILHNASASDVELVKFIAKKLEKAGVKVVYTNMYAMTARDFRTDILKMKEQSADMIFMFLASPTLEIMAKQMKEADFHPQMTSLNYFGYSPEFFEGQWFVQDAEGIEAFREYYAQRTGEKATSCVPNHYDSLKMIVEGFETAPAEAEKLPTNEAVVDKMLNNRDFRSVMGKIRIDGDGNVHTQPAVKMIKDGKILEVSK